MTPITLAEYQAASKTSDYLQGRWEYYSEAIRLVSHLGATSLLEVGPGPLPLFHDHITMDLRPNFKPTILWDATQTPWPLGDKTFDAVLSLQCFEHLGQAQVKAFQEASRVARLGVIISIPYRWKCPDPTDIHNGLDEDTVKAWTGRSFDRMIVVPPHASFRAVFLYRISPSEAHP